METPQPTRVKPQHMLNGLLRPSGPGNDDDAAYETVTLESEAYISFLQLNKVSLVQVRICNGLKCLQPYLLRSNQDATTLTKVQPTRCHQ